MTPHSEMAKVETWPGVLCNIEYPFETPLKVKARENSLVHNIGFNNLIVLKFCTVPCSVQNYKVIERLKHMLWTNEISRDLSLRCVSDGYPILHSTPSMNSLLTSNSSPWRPKDVHTMSRSKWKKGCVIPRCNSIWNTHFILNTLYAIYIPSCQFGTMQ